MNSKEREEQIRKRNIWLVLLVIVCMVGSVFLIVQFPTSTENKLPTEEKKEPVDQTLDARSQFILANKTSSSYGPVDAKVTVVIFSDFQCPYCKMFAESIDTLKKERKDVRFVFRHYPLKFHANAQIAAEYSECSSKVKNNFWEVHDSLFANQENLSGYLDTQFELLNQTQSTNPDAKAIYECMQKQDGLKQVAEDMVLGYRLGISGTPVFVVNGKMTVGALPYEQVKSIIDEAAK